VQVVSGLHRFLIQAIVDTYTVIPVGAAILKPTMYNTVIGFVSDYFVIGFRIALPVFITLTLMSCILGIMSRIAPQLNMFAIGTHCRL
jgi:flagellar biosynthetic protein FliR